MGEMVTALAGAAATSVAWRARRQLNLTVIVKATFAFAPDGNMKRAEPQPILRADVHHGKNPARSIRLTSDLAPFLPRADVVFTGHAHAPPGAPVTTLPLRLAVFDRDKACFDKTITAQDPAGFQRMPVVYERTYGGVGFVDNPLGVGAVRGSGEPSIVDPSDPTKPVGLGPFGSAWPARKRLLGTTRRAALEAPVAEIPDDFDWTYFQVAPADQRTEHLGGGEWIVLEGLHPTLPRVRTRLPSAHGLARVYGLGAFGVAEGQFIKLVADTLRIDGDEQRCTMVWRRSFPLYADEALAAVRVVAGVEDASNKLVWPEAPPKDSPAPADVSGSSGDNAVSTLEVPPEAPAGATVFAPEGAAPRPALPFGKIAPDTKPAAPPTPAQPKAPSPEAGGTVVLTFEDEEGYQTLPFVDAEPAPLAPPAPAPAPLAPPPPAPLAPPPAPLPTIRPVTHTPVRPLPSSPPPAPAAPVDDGRKIRMVHQTPFTVAVVPSGLAPGNESEKPSVIVIVSAVCDLVRGGPAKIRAKTDPQAGEEGARLKARADVTLVGQAHAPSPGARRGEAWIRFGDEEKGFERRVVVHGDRVWRRKGKGLPTISEPAPFDRIPLDYEHAYGGPGFSKNPVGRGHDLPTRGCDGAPLPNLEDPEYPIQSLAHEQEPACFGPVPPAVREHGQVAPPSQQVDFLAGDEPFEIGGVRPRGEVLEGTLPGARARSFVRLHPGAGGGFVEVPLQLDTAAFDTAAMTLRIVFRGTVSVEDEARPGKTIACLFVMSESQPGERATLEQARAKLEGRAVPEKPRSP